MNRKPDRKLAAARTAQAATEKALLLAEVAAKRAHTAKVDFKLAKKTWKLARKAAKRTAKEARLSQKKLAKFASLLKKLKLGATSKSVRAKKRRSPRKTEARRTTRPATPFPVPTPSTSSDSFSSGEASAG